MRIIVMVLAVLCLVPASGADDFRLYRVRPTFGGGYTVSGPDTYLRASPTFAGGYRYSGTLNATTFSGSLRPTFGGGFSGNFYYGGCSTYTRATPTFSGGYNLSISTYCPPATYRYNYYGY